VEGRAHWRHATRSSGHTGPVYDLIPDLGTASFLSASGDGLVVRWPLDAPEHGAPVAQVGRAIFSLLLDGGRLWLGDEDGGLHRVDLASRREEFFTRPHTKGIFRMVRLSDGRLVCAGGDGHLSIWADGPDGLPAPLRNIPLSEGKLRDLALDPTHRTLAVACGDGTARLLDTERWNELRTITAHTKGVSALAWHPSKPVLISGGKDGHLRCWTMDGRQEAILDLPAHTGAIYAIRSSADGRWCATAGRDRNVKIWDTATFDPVARLDRTQGGHTHSVNSLLWAGDRLFTASDDRTILGWMP
jgi:WD repeat-containing protein 61